MKRVFIVSLLFMLLLSVTVFAEDIELAPIEDGFDGFSWGISKEEIKRAYPSYGAITEGSGNLYHTNLNEDSISNIPLWNTIYMFDNGKLNTGIYIITDSGDENEEQLLQYLIEVYGEPDESYPAGSEVVKHDYFTEEDKTYSCCYTWLTPDGANELSFKKEPNSSQIELSYHVDLNTLSSKKNEEKSDSIDAEDNSDMEVNSILVPNEIQFNVITKDEVKRQLNEAGYTDITEKENALIIEEVDVDWSINDISVTQLTLKPRYVFLFKDDKCEALLISNLLDGYYDFGLNKVRESIGEGSEVIISDYKFAEYNSGENVLLICNKYNSGYPLNDLESEDDGIVIEGASSDRIKTVIDDYNANLEKEIEKHNSDIGKSLPRTWTKTYYVDEFGDPTDKSIYVYSAEGTFSNSATKDSDMDVRVVLDLEKESFRFQFIEYNGKVDATFFDKPTIKVKEGDTIIVESSMYRSDDWNYAYLDEEPYKTLLNALCDQDADLRVAVVDRESKYLFTFSK